MDSPLVARMLEHRDRFPERDRLLVEARRLSSTRDERIDRLQQVTEKFPSYWPAWLIYQDQLVHGGPYLGYDYGDARAALERLRALNPDLIAGLVHLFWITILQRDTAASGQILEQLGRLRYDSISQAATGLNTLVYFRTLDQLARSGDVLSPANREAGISELTGYRGVIAHVALAPGLLNYGFPAAQIELSRAVIGRAPAADIRAAHRRALALAWAARGAWDSALVAADRRASLVGEGAARLEGYGLAVTGSWLGAVDTGVVRGWRDRVRPLETSLEVDRRAELAWLDGLAGFVRRDGDAVTAARAVLADLDTRWQPVLDRSLAAFQLDIEGRPGEATQQLVELEDEIARRWPLQALSQAVPYLNPVHRITAARWLTAIGEPERADRLLLWYQAVFPSYAYRSGQVNRALEGIALFERARAAAAMGHDEQSRDLYRRFLRRYDMLGEAHRWMEEEAAAALVDDDL